MAGRTEGRRLDRLGVLPFGMKEFTAAVRAAGEVRHAVTLMMRGWSREAQPTDTRESADVWLGDGK